MGDGISRRRELAVRAEFVFRSARYEKLHQDELEFLQERYGMRHREPIGNKSLTARKGTWMKPYLTVAMTTATSCYCRWTEKMIPLIPSWPPASPLMVESTSTANGEREDNRELGSGSFLRRGYVRLVDSIRTVCLTRTQLLDGARLLTR